MNDLILRPCLDQGCLEADNNGAERALKPVALGCWLFFSFCISERLRLAFRSLYYTFVVYFFFWLYVTQVDRYLSPICVVATFLSIAFLYYLTLSCVSWIWSAGSSALRRSAYPGVLFLLALVPTTVHAYSRAVSKLEKWERSLLERPGYEMFQQAK